MLNESICFSGGSGTDGSHGDRIGGIGQGGAGHIAPFFGDEMATARKGEGMAARRRWRRKKDVVGRVSWEG